MLRSPGNEREEGRDRWKIEDCERIVKEIANERDGEERCER